MNFDPADIINLEETDSTSNYLQALSNQGDVPEFTSVIANYQTLGKGQRGNSWSSEKGKNLLFSFILYPVFVEAKKQFYLSKIISLAIKDALSSYCDGITIKWPNDIYWKDRKICGTLIENDLQGNKIVKSIAGVGVNINQKVFNELIPNPVSLINITNTTHNRVEVFNAIMDKVRHYYALLKDNKEKEIDSLYHESLYRKNGYFNYTDVNGIFKARIVEVLPEGFLILEDDNGKKKQYAFKEVQYI